jgi:hypothetical protein
VQNRIRKVSPISLTPTCIASFSYLPSVSEVFAWSLFATLLPSTGTHRNIVQGILGHATISQTVDTHFLTSRIGLWQPSLIAYPEIETKQRCSSGESDRSGGQR